MPKFFCKRRFCKINIINFIGLILMIAGAIITIVNIPIWLWMSVVGIILMLLGLLLYNKM